ncbi:hypothetical protein [Mycobacteroides abscessus]|uniref:hypothetical protein n=1 Tax=Mycobacteroides abscessus TaxID=36809 RepID=UPI000C26A50F|nr:hypothetical protein [Mycobacteroides abscessus]MBN7561422.1 hypothetical protein [Mycobacteroides abscessus subsp. abscessus]
MTRVYLIVGAGIGLAFWITNSLHSAIGGWLAFGVSVLAALCVGVWSMDSDGVKADLEAVRDARAAIREVRSETDDGDREVLDYPEDFDDEDDELDEEDMDFLRKATDPLPSAPAPSAPPAGGNLLSSLRQQGGVQ